VDVSEKALELFREAIEAENRRDLETAKRKLDDMMELTRKGKPELYFEACFRMANLFLQENNYRGAVKCAIRAIYRAPNEELRTLGIKRLADILTILKNENRLGELAENMEPTLGLVRDDEELYSFVKGLVKIAEGKRVEAKDLPGEFRGILEDLRE